MGAWPALALALLLLLPLPAAGAPLHGAGDLWNHYSIRDGLPSANVSAVFRAVDGSVWFGTDSGAARYDGSWQAVAPDDGLPVGRVRAIAQATDGAIWFGLDRSGVARRADGACCQSWNRASGLPSADVRALMPAPDGGMWIGTGAGAVFYDGSNMAPLGPLADVPIWSMARGRDGSEWFGTAGRGVWRISGGQVARVGGDELPRGEVYALWVDEAGQAWAGTDNGVYRLVGGAWQPFPLGAAAGARVFSILPDPAGGIWFGADQGLFYYDGSGSTVERFGRAGGMVSEYVRAMSLDGDGALWLGTVGGVSRYGGRIWRAERETGLRGQAVNAVYTDRSGRTWAGADGKGVALWDGKTWRWFGSAEGLADAQVFSLHEDRSGRMWAGTASGVALWDGSGAWRSFGAAEGIETPPVWAIGDDAGGDLWIGTEKGILRGNERKGFQPVAEFAGRRVNAVYSSADGTMWVGTHDHGLWRLGGTAWEQVTGLDGPAFSSVVLSGIAEYPPGVLWVGTYDNRLWRLEAGKWQQAEGKLSSPLVSALSATGGSLWVGTRSGLNRYDGRTWQGYAGTVLPNGEIRSIAPGPGRAVWVASSGGLVRYQPEASIPWVKIRSLDLQEPSGASVRLADTKLHRLELEAGDLSTRPEDLLYVTQIEPGGQEQVHYERTISLSQELPPGVYTLRVWARDLDFNYSEPAVLRFEAPQPGSAAPAKPVTAPATATAVVPKQSAAPSSAPALLLGGLLVAGLVAGGAAGWRRRRRAQPVARPEPTPPTAELIRDFNPFIAGRPVDDPRMFFARDDLLQRIVNGLHNNSVMVHGERHLGKTSLLYQLAERLRRADDPEWVFVPVYVDLQGMAQGRFFYLMMEGILGVIAGFLPLMPRLRYNSAFPASYSDRDLQADLRVLLDVLHGATGLGERQVRMILLLDEADTLSAYDVSVQQQFRRILIGHLAGRLGVVMAGTTIHQAWSSIDCPWHGMFQDIELELFDDAQARALLTEPVRGYYEWEPQALERAIAVAEGRPGRLQQLGLVAVEQMLRDGRTNIVIADVEVAAGRDAESGGDPAAQPWE